MQPSLLDVATMALALALPLLLWMKSNRHDRQRRLEERRFAERLETERRRRKGLA